MELQKVLIGNLHFFRILDRRWNSMNISENLKFEEFSRIVTQLLWKFYVNLQEITHNKLFCE